MDGSTICVFKHGSIPTLYEDACERLKLVPNNRLVARNNNPDITYVYRWLDALKYRGLRLSFIEVSETDTDGNTHSWSG